MSMGAVIRPLRRADLEAAKAIIDGCGLFPAALLDGMVAGYLSDTETADMWLVHDDGVVAGIAYCAPERMTQGTWNLLLIAVEPGRQGSGIGTAIMRHVERDLTARGHHLLLVETSALPAFERTRRFYCGMGYAEEARLRDYYQVGEDKVVFRKALSR